MNCSSEDKYTQKDGICCDRCAAGQYMLEECDDTHTTKCGTCGPNRYTATKNHMSKCHLCKHCSSINHQEKVEDCTAQENRVCWCMPGFYCSNYPCDHCWEATRCLLGEGVKVQAAHTNDTLCAPCQDGTYSNVTDSQSACRAHTRCEDFGRVLKTPGTPKADAICGNFKSHCPWILPTGLWSGLLLTALILFALICWRARRKSYRAEKKETRTFLQNPFTSTADSCVAVSLGEMASSPITEGHHRDSCPLEGGTTPLFTPDDSVVSCDTHKQVDGSLPPTPLRASVSFTDSHHINGNAGYRPGPFLRTYSEPQEDEWCGT